VEIIIIGENYQNFNVKFQRKLIILLNHNGVSNLLPPNQCITGTHVAVSGIYVFGEDPFLES